MDSAHVFQAAERFANYGNYVVGFAVAQMLAFLYGLIDYELLQRIWHHAEAFDLVIALSGALYGGLIWGAYLAEKKLLLAAHSHKAVLQTARWAFRGRMLVIVIVTIGGILGFHAARSCQY